MEKQQNFISSVIYLHNEHGKIVPFMEMLQEVLETYFEKYEVICVDDGSVDGTVEELKEYMAGKKDTRSVSLIHMSYYQGVEAAMNAGRDFAVGDFIYEFDSICLDYDPSLIFKLYQRALEGNDVVSASPKHTTGFTSRLFYKVYNWGNRIRHNLEQERFRLVSRRAVNRVNQLNTYVPYRKAMYVNCGLAISVIYYENKPFTRRNRNKEERGSRNILAFDAFIIFTDLLEKISLVLCGVFLAVMLIMAGYVVYSLFGATRPVEGWMSIMGLISFGFFGLFLLLTLILKYLSVILNLSFRKQRYVIENVEKLTK